MLRAIHWNSRIGNVSRKCCPSVIQKYTLNDKTSDAVITQITPYTINVLLLADTQERLKGASKTAEVLAGAGRSLRIPFRTGSDTRAG